MSHDSGASFINYAAGLVDSSAYSLLLVGSSLLAGTQFNGVWKHSVKDILAVSNATPNPALASIENIYPNPFNPSTTISYSLPRSGFVTIEISDVLGRTVAKIISQEQSEGIHSVAWDAATVAHGTYLARLTFGNASVSKKLVLMR